MEMLPDVWISQTGVQLHSLTTFISQDSEFVDWKKFLVLASTALPMPSRDELFNTLSRFMNIDVEKTGLVSEQQFLQVKPDVFVVFLINNTKSKAANPVN